MFKNYHFSIVPMYKNISRRSFRSTFSCFFSYTYGRRFCVVLTRWVTYISFRMRWDLICSVCGDVEAVNCHKTAFSYGLLYYSIFILSDNCHLSLHGTLPPFILAVSWVNYINVLNELIGRGHWWCYAFRFFYKTKNFV